MTSFQDPSFDIARLALMRIVPAAILEWLKLGGCLQLPPKFVSWRKKGRRKQVELVLLVVGGAVCLAVGWLLQRLLTG